MRGCLFVLVSAGLRGEPEHTDPDNKPEPLEGDGKWVWVPTSNVQQDSGPDLAAENAAAEQEEKAQEAEDAKKDERNRKIWAMKEDVMKLKMVMTNLQQAYDAANNVAGEVTENMNDWGTLSSSLLQTEPQEEESKDQLALDESFDGLHELTDRVEKANEILKTQMDKIPDTIIAPSTMKLVKSPEDLLKGPSSFLEEPDDGKQMAEEVREKKWEKKAEEKLKETFADLEQKKADLKRKGSSLTQSLDHLESLAEKPLPQAPAPIASLVEASRGGHWEWRASGTKHTAHHRAQHHAHHRAQHRHRGKAKHHAKPVAPADMAVDTSEAAEMKALDDAMAPLEKITQGVKDEQREMNEKLTELAQGAALEVTHDANMRRN